MLDRLEAADRAGELAPLLYVADGRVQAPLGQAELLAGQQAGPGEQRRGDGVLGLLSRGQAPRRRPLCLPRLPLSLPRLPLCLLRRLCLGLWPPGRCQSDRTSQG